MPEFRYARGRINESLQFIAGEMKEFEQDYSSKTWKDYEEDSKLQKLIDRTIENILTALIEICGTILAQEDIPVESYAQVLKECGRLLGFSEEEQEKLAKLAIQRNRLAHRYLNLRWEAVKMFNDAKPLVFRLLKRILEREKRA
jgi:uncharacterized protein YutE (UPF0331/DUF86 family)